MQLGVGTVLFQFSLNLFCGRTQNSPWIMLGSELLGDSRCHNRSRYGQRQLNYGAKFNKAELWLVELGESNPRPFRIHRPRYDHSRGCGPAPTRESVESEDITAGSFSGVSVFPTVSGLSLLSTTTSVAGSVSPGIITGPDDSYRLVIRRRERHESCRVLFAPFWSLSNSGRTIRRNNRHVETDQPLVK